MKKNSFQGKKGNSWGKNFFCVGGCYVKSGSSNEFGSDVDNWQYLLGGWLCHAGNMGVGGHGNLG
jgi:hypothetical protein